MKNKRDPVVVLQVRSADVLPIAAQVCESQGPVVENVNEPSVTTAKLDIGPSGFRH